MYVELDGEKIFAWRYANVARLEEAAQMAGISPSAFLRAENGTGRVTLRTARKIAALLDVELDALIR